MSGKAPRVLLVTSDGASPAAVTPVLAALEAGGLKVRAIDVGRVGSRADGALDRIVRTLVGEFAERRLMKELGSYPPDAVVVFDPGTASALTAAREQATKPAPVVAVIDALSPVAQSAETDADRYLVVDDEAAVALADHGVEGERVMPVGAIGEATFAEAAGQARTKLRDRFKLGAGTVVLVEVAGLGYDATSQIALQLSLSESRATYLFDAGDDSDAATALRRQVPTLGMPAKLFGETADAPLYWRCADVIIARPKPRNVARALLLGARMVALLPEDKSGQDLATALTERGVGVAASNALLLTSALDQLLKSGKASADLAVDGAANVADIVWVVGAERGAVIDERHAAARAATRQRVEAATAAADAAARVSSAAGGLEDLSGGVAYSDSDVPDAGEVARLRAEVNTRIGQVSKTVFAAREAAERWDKRHGKAVKKGEAELAREAERNADGERARMHQALAELSQLQSELKGLERAATAAARPRPSGPARTATPPRSRPRPAAPSVDDLLDKMKREQRGGTSTATAGQRKKKKKKKRDDSLDDELAELKRKMAAKKRKGR